MFKKFVNALVISAVLGLPVAALAAPSSHCGFEGQRITKVTPYKESRYAGRSSVPVLAGAIVYVEAQPGLTAQWLQLSLSRHIAAMRSQSMSNCPLDADVKVSVVPAGTTFAVKIVAKPGTSAEQVLKLARSLAA